MLLFLWIVIFPFFLPLSLIMTSVLISPSYWLSPCGIISSHPFFFEQKSCKVCSFLWNYVYVSVFFFRLWFCTLSISCSIQKVHLWHHCWLSTWGIPPSFYSINRNIWVISAVWDSYDYINKKYPLVLLLCYYTTVSSEVPATSHHRLND